jgi:hypothetical protein
MNIKTRHQPPIVNVYGQVAQILTLDWVDVCAYMRVCVYVRALFFLFMYVMSIG